MRGSSVGVDVGGTFTDLVAIVDGELRTAKVPSVPDDQAVGVAAALRAAGVEDAAVDVLAHGTTVATNALLERRGARTALVTTEGFRDVIEIARQKRASLYDLAAHHPPPLVPRELRFVVRERMGPAGVVVPLDEESLAAAVTAVRAAEAKAVAVCFLFGFLHPEHERRAGEALRIALPGVRVSLSSEVLPEFREYERFSTTVANAYLGPALASYLERLEPRPLVMQSSGGVVDVSAAVERPAACVLSGPAAGVVGAAFVAALAGFRDVLTFDMGGTSTDVAAVVDGEVQVTPGSVVGGVPIRFPMVDLHSVGAGGGSVAWIDEGGALRVGPRSTGARPGPACYGRGGEEPTVTDANVLLGYLADGAVLGGEVRLERARAERALAQLTVDESSQERFNPGLRDWVANATSPDAPGRVVAAALGVVRVADAEMVRALRVISVERGLDPREFALLAFGGAGPLHACSLAEELGLARVLVPRASGVLSALGLAVADLRRDYVAPTQVAGEPDEALAALVARAGQELPEADLTRLVDARYRGQSHELTVPAEEWRTAFGDAHERRYGFRLEADVEAVNVRVVAARSRPRPSLATAAAAGARDERRRIYLDDAWIEVPVLGPDAAVAGPAIVELPEATCLVRPGWSGEPDPAGTLVLERAWTP
jgi:N-methylhydantoinase A